MTLAVSGRAFYYRRLVGYAWLLRRLWNAIDIAAQRNHRAAAAPFCHPGRWYSRDAFFDRESILLKDTHQVFGGFEFLEPQFAEAEDHIDHFLHGFFLAADSSEGCFFQAFNIGGIVAPGHLAPGR